MAIKQLQKVYWQDVRKAFTKINPKLLEIIDTISPDKKFPLLKITYSFGEKILEDGRFILLDSVDNNAALDNLLKEQKLSDMHSLFGYSPIPLGAFLNKTCEVFVEIQDRIIPVFVLAAGDLLGIFETLDVLCGVKSTPLWNIRAGARSAFMLPKINNALWHKKLIKHFNVNVRAPKNLEEQWNVFHAIANSKVAKSDWACEVIFFPKIWIDHLQDKSEGWTRLREHLFQACWTQASSMIEKSFSFLWQQFSLSTIRRNYKPRIYITDTIRHLISITMGFVPGFIPSQNENSAPINLIKTAYHDIYNLPYAPTMMEPSLLHQADSSVYYSLGYPTLLEGHPEVSNIYNTISDLKEIKTLIENMFRYCQTNSGNVKAFSSIAPKINFDYFHKAQDIQGEIKTTEEIITVDSAFAETNNTFKDKGFCTTAPFFNGCIRIKK